MSWVRSNRMFYSVEEVAEKAGIPVSTLKHRIHSQETLKPLLLGKTLIFSQEQLDDLIAKGETARKVDAEQIFTTEQAVEYLNSTHQMGISYDSMVLARHWGALPHERIGGSDDRASLVLFHRDDLDVFAASRGGAQGLVVRERGHFSAIEAETYTDSVLGVRVPRPTLVYNVRVGRIHPALVEGIMVFSAEQLRDYVQSGSKKERRTDIRVDLSGLMTVDEAAEYLGIAAQEVRYYMFVDPRLPYEPVGVSPKGVQLYLLQREHVETLREELEK